jgi:predicted ArsR family transcriptional regulator
MREVGLLEFEVDARGGVGRPQHRYSLAPDAPSLGFEPPTMPVLTEMLLDLVEATGVSGDDVAEAGRRQGRRDARRYGDAPSYIEALVAELDRLGFDPAVGADDEGEHAVIAFAHCPFRSLAEAHPDLVCSLHRGLVEGFVDAMGDAEVLEFCPLAHRTPCQVALTTR